MFGILRWHTLERLFFCCTFLLVRLVSCSAFIVFVSARFASYLLLLDLSAASCKFGFSANTILNFFAIFYSFLS